MIDRRVTAIWHRLTELPADIRDRQQRENARLLTLLLVTVLPLGLLIAIIPSLFDPSPRILTDADVLALASGMVLWGIAYGLGRAGHYELASRLSIVLASVVIFVIAILDQDFSDLHYLIVPVLLSSLLLPMWESALFAAINLALLLLIPVFEPGLTLANLAVGPLSFVLIGSALILLVARHRDQLERERRIELEQSESRHRRLVETSPEPIIVHSGDKLVYANLAGAKLLGATSPDQLIDEPIFQFVHPDYQEIARERIRQILEEGKDAPPIEETFIRLDGQVIDVEVAGTPIIYQGRPAVQLAARDITRYKQVEEALKQSEREKALILDSMVDVFTYYDTELRIQWVNRTAGDSVEATTKDLVGRHCYEVWHQRKEPCDDCPAIRTSKTGEPHESEITTPDGRIWLLRSHPVFDEDGDIVGLIEFGQDITERKQAEKALQRSLEEIQTLQQITAALLSLEDLPQIMDAVAEGIVTHLGYTMVLVSRYQEAENEFVGLALYPRPTPKLLEYLLRFVNHPIPMDEPAQFRVPYRRGENPILDRVLDGDVVVRNSLADFVYPWIPRSAADVIQRLTGIEVLIDLPMRVKGRTVGTIVASVVSAPITASKRRALIRVADQAAAVLENAQLYEQAQREIAERKRVEREIKERQRYLEGVLDATPDAIVTLDAERRVVEWNPGAERMFGYTPEETVGRNLDDLITNPETYEEAVGFTRRALNRKHVGPLESIRYRKDGSPVDVILAGAPIVLGDELIGLVAAYTDITERKRAEAVLAQRATQLAALNYIGRQLTAILDQQELLQQAVDAVREDLGYLQVAILLMDEEGRELYVAAATDNFWEVIPESYRQPVGKGAIGLAAETGEAVVINDARSDPRPYRMGDWLSPSSLSVPIEMGERVIGVLEIESDVPDAFDESDVTVMSTLADQIATAMENARLYKEARQRTAQLEALREVGLELIAQLDLDVLLHSIVSRAVELLGGMAGGMYLYRPDRDVLEWGAIVGPSPVPAGSILHRGEGLSALVWETGEPFAVDDYQRWPGHVARYEDLPLAAVAAAPVQRENEFLGVLIIESEMSFLPGDMELLHMFATQAAIAIRNARLYEESRRWALEQETLRESALALTTTLDRDEVVERILAQLQQVVPYDTASVQLFKGEQLEIVGGRGFPNLDEIVGITFDPSREDNPNSKVVQTRAPFIVANVSTRYAEFKREPHAAAGIHSWLGVPMLMGDRLVGMIALDKQESGFYTQAHARLAEAFAAQAAIAVENSRLFQAEREQRELTEALEEAATAVSSTLDLDQVLDRILEQVERVVVGDACNVVLMEQGNTVQIVRWRGYESLGAAEPVSRLRVHISEYPKLTAMMMSGRSVVVPDASIDPDWTSVEGWEWLRSYVGAPARVGGVTVGFLNVVSTQPNQFSSADARRLEAFASHAATAIENARLYQQVLDYAQQLEQRVRERTAELQSQYARLDAILRSTADGIVVTDEEGEILQANPVARAWLSQTLSPKEVTRLRTAVRRVVAQTRTEALSDEHPVELLELTGLDLELSGAPILESGEGKEAAVVAIHDVSHLKALDRMKTRFVTNVSHELRTPVTTVKLYTHLMQQQPERWKEYLAPLAQEADHQAQLVEDILQISRIDAGRLEMRPSATPLNELAEAVVDSHQVLAQQLGLTLAVHPASPGPVAMVDSARITQVLSNLVGNALRYTTEGDRVTVSTGIQETGQRRWAITTVTDTGMGIPEDELPHIFDRFFRGKEPREMQLTGTGLGLTIVKEIVELHGGRVTVRSEVGMGSIFTVWLPLMEE